MKNIESGWLLQTQCKQGLSAQKTISPNFDARPIGTIIDTVIIHAISLPPAQYGGDEVGLFQNKLDFNAHIYFKKIKNLRVSTHFYIQRDGELTQFVNVFHRAWHAGPSDFLGRHRVNDFSVGIELEGTDTDIFMPAQYQCLNTLLEDLGRILPDLIYIAAHSDIAPRRKTDPGKKFAWQKIKSKLIRPYSNTD